MVWVVDEDGLRVLGYPDGEPIPDYYGTTSDRVGILFELKSADHVRKALKQLEKGLDLLPALGQRVDRLGISVERLTPAEGYYATLGTKLLAHKRLVHGSPIKLGRRKLEVMVEKRREVP